MLVIAELGTPVSARAADGEWGEVKELEFGELLFEFYAQDSLAALNRAYNAGKNRSLTHHREHAELLLGGLYLSYGMHMAGSEVLTGLLDRDIDLVTRDRAWFYLGKIRYQRGYFEQAREAFEHTEGHLPVTLAEERDVLLANTLLSLGMTDGAIDLLRRVKNETRWSDYARYNLGVTLLYGNREEDGVELLQRVGKLKPVDDEALALRDGANLVLGYLALQRGAPGRAQTYLEEVRLDGLFSNKALLGMGWARSAANRDEQALVYWNELEKRETSDIAVQEALLAIPYAYERLKASKRALKEYRTAIARFEAEIEQLDKSIALVTGGGLLQQLLVADARRDSGWLWSLPKIPDSQAGQELFELLSSHEFQEGVKNYRDLYFLRKDIERSMNDLDVLGDVVEARRASHGSVAKRVHVWRGWQEISSAKAELAATHRRLASIAANEQDKALALATADERAMLSRLAGLRRVLAGMGDGDAVAALERRRQRLEGLLTWEIRRDFKPRLWEARKALLAVDGLYDSAHRRAQRLSQLEGGSHAQSETRERINTQRRRAAQLLKSLDRVEFKMLHYLQALATKVLTERRRRTEAFLAQARFGVAQVFDRALQPALKEGRR